MIEPMTEPQTEPQAEPAPDVPRPSRLARFRQLRDRIDPIIDPDRDQYTQAALARHKREGLNMAVRARWIALAIIACLLPVLNFSWEILWYEVLLLAMAGVGWLQKRVGRVGRSMAEFAVMVLDLALMTFILVFPNPFETSNWPAPLFYHFGNFLYLFVILAAGTLAYSWRTILAIGNWTAWFWAIGAIGIHLFGARVPELTEAIAAAVGTETDILDVLDPNRVKWDMRLQEIVVFLIVAAILAFSIRRLERLVLGNAALERERTNLSRYFSPRMVEELSRNDEPLKETREHEVAVLFVDIEGFTGFASARSPQEVIAVLRRFHAMMEAQVFGHEGTLDKFLGDGLMATFGTPLPGERDAENALAAMRAMIADMERWNAERAAAREAPIRARFGLHYGPVVLGDIGATQLEFAVIGHTVNVASRLEALTRDLGAVAVISDEMRAALGRVPEGFARREAQAIRGIDGAVTVWTLE